MLISAVFIPGAPALVPEVSGPGAIELEPVRAAVRAAVADQAAVSDSWWAVGAVDHAAAPSSDGPLPPAGSLGGFGVDRRVALVPGTPEGLEAGVLPTSMLIAGWAREAAAEPVRATPLTVSADPSGWAAVGRELAGRIAEADGDTALLIVGDGAIHLDDKAPGGSRQPDAVALQEEIDAALASGDPAALRALDAQRCERWGVSGRGPWEVLAACVPGRATATVGYAGAPLGVGYNVVTWRFG